MARVLAAMCAAGALESLGEPAAALARLHLARGRVDEALQVTEYPLCIMTLKEAWLWATDLAPARVDALVAAGRTGDATELVARFGGGVRGVDAPAAHAAVSLCGGIICEGRGQQARAAALFNRAAAAWDALPRPYDALLSRERQARCLVAAGSQAAGVTLLAEVRQGLTELGARGDADRVTLALRQHGVDVKQPWRRGRRGYGNQLSPRETDVVRLLVHGHTNPEIAKILFLSPRTVARHVDSAMHKLNVTSRTALAVKAIEVGAVPAGPTEAAAN